MHPRQFARQLRRSMTDAEHRLWFHLRAHRFDGCKFRRQQPLGPYIVDFVHFGSRLVIEADGGQHNDDPADRVRDKWLRGQGFRVLRFWNGDILQNTGVVLEEIWRALRAGPSPPAPLPQGERGAKLEQAEMSPSPLAEEEAHTSPSPLAEEEARISPSPLAGEEANMSPSPLAGEGLGRGGSPN